MSKNVIGNATYAGSNNILRIVRLLTMILHFHAFTLRSMSKKLHGMSECVVASLTLKQLNLHMFLGMRFQVPFVVILVVAVFTR